MLSYDLSKWQRVLYNLECDANPALKQAEVAGVKRRPQYDEYQKELFGRLYNPYTPKLKEITQDNQWVEKLHDCADQLVDFRVLQQQTSGDEFWSGIATATISNEVQAQLKPAQSPVSVEALEDRISTLQDLADRGCSVDQRMAQAQRQLQQAKQDAKEAAQGVQGSAVRKAITKGAQKATEAIQRFQQWVESYSYGTVPGTPMSARNMDQKRDLAQKIMVNQKLQQIAELAGRMRIKAAEKQRSKTNYARSEVTSIEQGADLNHLLPSELGLLGTEFEHLFLARVAERKCNQYQLRGKETQARGPIVVCLDESGSMMGDRETYSKAMALALLDIAQRQKRSWCLIHFDSKVHKVDTFKAGEVDSKNLLDTLDHFTGGGTDFMHPLKRAVQEIRQDGAFKNADIILITDGQGPITPEFEDEFNRDKQELEFNLYTLLAVRNAYAGPVIDKISDEKFNLDDCMDSHHMGEMMQEKVFSM